MAALKEIRHSTFAGDPRTLCVRASASKRTKVIGACGLAPPEKFGGLFVVLSEMSGEGEILLSGIGLWS
jgi:hypothetical protein